MVHSINFKTAELLYSPKLINLCICNSSSFCSQLYLFYIYTPEVTHSLLNVASCEVRHSYREKMQNMVSNLLSLKKKKAKQKHSQRGLLLLQQKSARLSLWMRHTSSNTF